MARAFPSYLFTSTTRFPRRGRLARILGRSDALRVGLALTWEGSPWPWHHLPDRCRHFLLGSPSLAARFSSTQTRATPHLPPFFSKGVAQPNARSRLALLFMQGRVAEIRICWVPQLLGRDKTWISPFLTPAGKRISFQADFKFIDRGIAAMTYRPISIRPRPVGLSGRTRMKQSGLTTRPGRRTRSIIPPGVR